MGALSFETLVLEQEDKAATVVDAAASFSISSLRRKTNEHTRGSIGVLSWDGNVELCELNGDRRRDAELPLTQYCS